MLKTKALFLSLFLCFQVGQNLWAEPVQLPAIPQAPEDHLPIDDGMDNYPCDQIADKLEAYNTMARQHDSSVTGFLGQVTDKLNEWYALLQPLEGNPATIQEGAFQPLQDGATQISTVTDAAYDNSSLLAQEMDRILISLRACSISSKLNFQNK